MWDGAFLLARTINPTEIDKAARRAFPVKDGGSIHGFDIIIVEDNLPGAPAGSGHTRRRENDAGVTVKHLLNNFVPLGSRLSD